MLFYIGRSEDESFLGITLKPEVGSKAGFLKKSICCHFFYFPSLVPRSCSVKRICMEFRKLVQALYKCGLSDSDDSLH